MKTPISSVIRMADAVEETSIASVLASVLNCDQEARRAMSLPSAYTAADVQRIARHFHDLVTPLARPSAVLGEAAVSQAVSA